MFTGHAPESPARANTSIDGEEIRSCMRRKGTSVMRFACGSVSVDDSGVRQVRGQAGQIFVWTEA